MIAVLKNFPIFTINISARVLFKSFPVCTKVCNFMKTGLHGRCVAEKNLTSFFTGLFWVNTSRQKHPEAALVFWKNSIKLTGTLPEKRIFIKKYSALVGPWRVPAPQKDGKFKFWAQGGTTFSLISGGASGGTLWF